MTRKFVPASQALKQAYAALNQGDNHTARYWAQVTLTMVPNMEDPWLILAAVAKPRASLVYLKQALEINPNSPRARAGLEWAKQRQSDADTQPVRRKAVAAIPAAPASPAALVVAQTPGLASVAVVPAAGVLAGPIAKKKTRFRPRPSRDKRIWGLILISPWIIGLLLFKLAPLLATLGISFTDFYLLTPNTMSFVGLKNYIDMFKDPNLWAAFWGTIKLALIVLPLQTVAAILLAALLSNEKLRMKDTLRVLFFLPSIIPSAAALFMWQGFVNPKTGWLNPLLLNPLGLAKLIHFTSRGDTPSLLILSTLWSIGPGFMIIMGSMQGIPTDIFEAALVDGANRLRRFFTITLPMVTPAIFFTFILNLTAIFGGAILLDRGYSFNSNVSSVDNYLYFILFNTFRLGSAASLAWIFFIFLLVVVLVLFATSKRWVYFPDQEN
jgi:multiple sugar transport system permease protein